MAPIFGIIMAFIALLGWGFGDFLIQRTTRLVGSFKALFMIGIVGLVIILPFIKNDFSTLQPSEWLLLSILGIVSLCAGIFNFEGLRHGKIAVIEPVLGLELPLTVGFSITLGREQLVPFQFILIALVFVGIVLAVTTHYSRRNSYRRFLEKGVILAGVGAVGIAFFNFLVGVASQNISPWMAIWFSNLFVVIGCGIYLLRTKSLFNLIFDLKNHPRLLIGQSVIDNIAWLAFAFATTAIPISIAMTISESYIALAVLLGIFVNREKLYRYQIIGMILAIIGVITLAYFSS